MTVTTGSRSLVIHDPAISLIVMGSGRLLSNLAWSVNDIQMSSAKKVLNCLQKVFQPLNVALF